MYVIHIKLHPGASVNYYVCPVIQAVISGDKPGLECMLRYGYEVNEFQMEKFNEEYYNPCRMRCTLGQQFTRRFRLLKRKDKVNSVCLKDCHLVCTCKDFEEYETHGSARKHVVNEVFIFLLRLSTIHSQRKKMIYIDCFHRVWRSRTTPYVKVKEILEIINQSWINLKCPFQCWRSLENICNLYIEELREIAEGHTTPRSLQHLSRYAVRKAIMKSYSWDKGIEDLNIPLRMKLYLHLEF